MKTNKRYGVKLTKTVVIPIIAYNKKEAIEAAIYHAEVGEWHKQKPTCEVISIDKNIVSY